MAEWEAYRSRKIVWAKPHNRPNGGQQMRTKEGEVIQEETFKREWQKIDDSDSHNHEVHISLNQLGLQSGQLEAMLWKVMDALQRRRTSHVY